MDLEKVYMMENDQSIKELKFFAANIRLETLKIIASIGAGHVGGCMSIADAIAVLYGKVLNIDPKDPLKKDRDWCVLSKGHAGPVLYAALGLKGYFPMEEAYTLNHYRTKFPSHTDRTKTPGVDLTAGSLGQGISEAAGAALGNRMQGIGSYVYVFVGDGECDEGEVWEAAQFSAHYKLDHLICFVDDNRYQLDGFVDDVMSHGPGLAAKFKAFGWNTIEVEDGNDIKQIIDAIDEAKTNTGSPSAIVLHTVKGKGTFAENTHEHSTHADKAFWDKAIAKAQNDLEALKGEIL